MSNKVSISFDIISWERKLYNVCKHWTAETINGFQCFSICAFHFIYTIFCLIFGNQFCVWLRLSSSSPSRSPSLQLLSIIWNDRHSSDLPMVCMNLLSWFSQIRLDQFFAESEAFLPKMNICYAVRIRIKVKEAIFIDENQQALNKRKWKPIGFIHWLYTVDFIANIHAFPNV